MDVIKIAVLGIVGLILCLIVKELRPEYASYISMATGICILLLATGKLEYLLDMVKKMEKYVPIDSTYLYTLFKMIGITYVGQFSAGLCKDAGYSSIAGQIEVFCKLSILALSMPILSSLLDTIQGFLT
ncbi:stage III sporulation protein AD [Blautia liquoris]|uniref:Stage III sporulation protein AD n=1 Tax=Blautia liquoris TaxID=2779518 RepID=A0A7M2RIT2_9FIRM|nr:stage III sporulation protein AD [Blautia liquoris]